MKKKTTGNQENKSTKGTQPIKSKEEVQQSKDNRIDQDFPGFPHLPATEDAIKKKKNISTKL